MISSVRGRIIILVALVALSLTGFLWVLQQRAGYEDSRIDVVKKDQPPVQPVAPPAVETPSPSTTSSEPTPSPSLAETAPVTPGVSPPPPPANVAAADDRSALGYVGRLKLIVPVAGVKPQELHDTYKDARSEGRTHDAIDIPAAAGTPVLAAADGEIVKLFQSVPGGTTIYQLYKDRKLIFYYAHLQGYADGLVEGKVVHRGDVIGYVGDTGNAGLGNYHLHFSISIVVDPKRYWEGTNINPYPILSNP
jgi:murein DD-endopeptidase MepM/ murein hydrolase activator NlpD